MMAAKPKRRAVNATGRNKYDRHLRLHHWLMKCEAWRSLNPCARAALIELYAMYNGVNNGEIFLSVRQLAGLLVVNPRTASKALADLTERGFVRIKQKGSFSQKVKHATLWNLTEFPCGDHPATKDFIKWRPPAKIQNTGVLHATDRCVQYTRHPILNREKAPLGGTGCIREAQ